MAGLGHRCHSGSTHPGTFPLEPLLAVWEGGEREEGGGRGGREGREGGREGGRGGRREGGEREGGKDRGREGGEEGEQGEMYIYTYATNYTILLVDIYKS